MSPKFRSRLTIAAFVVLGACVLIAVVLAAFDWALLVPFAARRLSASIGRSVTIDKAARVDSFSLVPRLRLEGVAIGQPGWAGPGAMITVRTLVVRLPILPLLAGRLRPREIAASGVRIDLRQDAGGRDNWDFGGPGGGGLPHLDALTIGDGRLRLLDERRRLTWTAALSADATGLKLDGGGNVRGEPLHATFSGASLNGRDPDAPYPFRFALRSPRVNLTAAGTMDHALDLAHFTARASSNGQDVAYLDAIILAGLPAMQDFRVSATVRRDNPNWTITRLDGVIGRSTLAGTVRVTKRAGRSILDATLRSTQLDFDDLLSDEGRRRAAAKKAALGERLVPDTPIHLEHLRDTDGVLRFDIAHLLLPPKSPFVSARGTFTLDHGQLALSPLTIGLKHGAATGRMRVDHRSGAPKLAIDVRIAGARLGDVPLPDRSTDAAMSGLVRLRGSGQTIRDAVSTADGTIAFAAVDGRIFKANAEFLGQDAGRGMIAGTDTTALRCAIVRFQGTRGVLAAAPLVIDTGVSRANGSGTLKLDGERLSLRLAGAAKKPRLLRLPAPIEVGGTLSQPHLSISAREAASPKGLLKVFGGVARSLGQALSVVPNDAEAVDADCAGLARQALR